MGIGWEKQKALVGCYLLLHLCVLFSLFYKDLSCFGYFAEERKYVGIVEEVGKKEKAVEQRLKDLGIKESGIKSVIPQCVKLGDDKPLALQLEGDVVIGGFFPLHYVASEPQHIYNNKPQMASCSG